MAAPAPIAVAAAPVDYHLRVNPNSVEIGHQIVPVGQMQIVHVYRNGLLNNGNPTVRIWSRGGMGNSGETLFDFELQAPERGPEFVKGLFEQAGPSFSLQAQLIKPTLIASEEAGKVKGEIFITFLDSETLHDFDDYEAPVFFPGFQTHVEQGNILKLTSAAGSPDETVSRMNNCFHGMNKHCFCGVGRLLFQNGDPRFHAPLPPPAVAANAPPSRNPHYTVSPDYVKKETSHIGTPPAGHVLRFGEGPHFYYEDDLLSEPTADDLLRFQKGIPLMIEQLEVASQIAPQLATAYEPAIKAMKAALASPPKTAIEYEVTRNFTIDLPQHTLDSLSAAQKSKLEELDKEFEERARKLKEEPNPAVAHEPSDA